MVLARHEFGCVHNLMIRAHGFVYDRVDVAPSVPSSRNPSAEVACRDSGNKQGTYRGVILYIGASQLPHLSTPESSGLFSALAGPRLPPRGAMSSRWFALSHRDSSTTASNSSSVSPLPRLHLAVHYRASPALAEGKTQLRMIWDTETGRPFHAFTAVRLDIFAV